MENSFGSLMDIDKFVLSSFNQRYFLKFRFSDGY